MQNCTPSNDRYNRQGWYVANELVRIWSNGSLQGLAGVDEDTRLLIASEIARRSHVPRRYIMRLFESGEPPSLQALVKIAAGLNRPLLLKFSAPVTIRLDDPRNMMTRLAKGLRELRGSRPVDGLGVSEQTITGAEGKEQLITLLKLFEIAAKLRIKLQIRFGQPEDQNPVAFSRRGRNQ